MKTMFTMVKVFVTDIEQSPAKRPLNTEALPVMGSLNTHCLVSRQFSRQYFHCLGLGGYCLGLDHHCLSSAITVWVLCLKNKTIQDTTDEIHYSWVSTTYDDIHAFEHPPSQLTSCHPIWADMTPVDISAQWWKEWLSASVVNEVLVTDPIIRQPGFGHFSTGKG